MSRRFDRWRRVLMIVAAVTCLTPLATSKKSKDEIPAVRWAEGNPGCTFWRGNDGKDRYGMWSDDVGIVMAVDSQELQKVHRRHELFFAVLLEVRYRGQAALDFTADNITLEFVKHFRVRQPALNPNDFADKVQNDADTLNDQTAQQVDIRMGAFQHKKQMDRQMEKARGIHSASADCGKDV